MAREVVPEAQVEGKAEDKGELVALDAPKEITALADLVKDKVDRLTKVDSVDPADQVVLDKAAREVNEEALLATWSQAMRSSPTSS